MAEKIYASGKEFAYDHVARDKVVTFAKGTDTRINIEEERSMKKKINEGHSFAVCGAVRRRHKRL